MDPDPSLAHPAAIPATTPWPSKLDEPIRQKASLQSTTSQDTHTTQTCHSSHNTVSSFPESNPNHVNVTETLHTPTRLHRRLRAHKIAHTTYTVTLSATTPSSSSQQPLSHTTAIAHRISQTTHTQPHHARITPPTTTHNSIQQRGTCSNTTLLTLTRCHPPSSRRRHRRHRAHNTSPP
jgi:hypothetical protein